MKYSKIAFVVAAATLTMLTANTRAAIVTQSYVTNTIFTSGPVVNLTQFFTLTYDPLATVNNAAVDAYSSDSLNPGLNVPVVLTTTQGGFHQIAVGGSLNGAGSVSSNTNDFFTYFYVDEAGVPLVGDPTTVAYTFETAPRNVFYTSKASVTTLRNTAAVPEPNTWAMMVGGFGLIGSAMRRRQKLAVRFA